MRSFINTKTQVEGVVIEGQVEAGLGKTATVLLSRGTLKPSHYLVCSKSWAKVRWIQAHRDLHWDCWSGAAAAWRQWGKVEEHWSKWRCQGCWLEGRWCAWSWWWGRLGLSSSRLTSTWRSGPWSRNWKQGKRGEICLLKHLSQPVVYRLLPGGPRSICFNRGRERSCLHISVFDQYWILFHLISSF